MKPEFFYLCLGPSGNMLLSWEPGLNPVFFLYWIKVTIPVFHIPKVWWRLVEILTVFFCSMQDLHCLDKAPPCKGTLPTSLSLSNVTLTWDGWRERFCSGRKMKQVFRRSIGNIWGETAAVLPVYNSNPFWKILVHLKKAWILRINLHFFWISIVGMKMTLKVFYAIILKISEHGIL